MNKKMREIMGKIELARKALQTAIDGNGAEEIKTKTAELRDLQNQYDAEKALYETEQTRDGEEGTPAEDTAEQADVKAFAGYVRAVATKTATPQNISLSNNGAIIPTTIANQIISKVKELCPILAGATIFRSKGKLLIPVYGDAADAESNAHNINVAFATEFTDLTADAGKFTSVELNGYLVGALTLIGKSVINNSDIDVVNFIVAEMGRRIAAFLENKLLNGESGKNTGALDTSNTMIAGSVSAISTDNLVDLQGKVASEYQGTAVWTMHPNTFAAIRKLKDSTGQYMLQPDMTLAFPYRILGKPVYLSDNMPVIASAAKAVLYGDYSGLAVNLREDVSVEVLTEKYATMHALGIVGWIEFDSNMMDNERLATLVMSAS